MEIRKPETNHFYKGLIYAPAGHGKTYFLGTAQDDPRTKPMLLLDYEGGTTTLVGRDIDIVPIHSWDDFSQVYAMLLSANHPYKSVGVDSISETHIFSLINILDTDGRTRKNTDRLEQGDYGIALVQMRRLVRKFRDLPLHIIFTALAKEVADPREGLIKLPAVPGSFADELLGIVDSVSYLAMGTIGDGVEDPSIHRFLLLKNYPSVRLKARTPMNLEIPNQIVDPTLGKLLDTLGFIEAPINSQGA